MMMMDGHREKLIILILYLTKKFLLTFTFIWANGDGGTNAYIYIYISVNNKSDAIIFSLIMLLFFVIENISLFSFFFLSVKKPDLSLFFSF
jgi:hypothetical protein